MSANNGAPAFPVKIEPSEQGRYFGERQHQYRGITMRDYFAAKAMQSMCDGPWPDSNDRPEIAKRAYLMADEMLKAREA